MMRGSNSPPTASSLLVRRPLETASCTFMIIAGFSFWFALGFPFANHNESYYWVALFADSGVLRMADSSISINYGSAG